MARGHSREAARLMLRSVWLQMLLCGMLWPGFCSGQQALPPMPAPIVVSDATGLANALATGRIANVQINGELVAVASRCMIAPKSARSACSAFG